MMEILKHLLLKDRIRFGKTSRLNYYLVSLALQFHITDLLRPFGLSHGDVRILQSATGTVISGSMLAAIVHLPFAPNDIDFYCNHRIGTNVVAYLENAGNFAFVDYSERAYNDMGGVKGVWTLEGQDNKTINVIETLARNPVRCVLGDFHSSAPRGVIEWSGVHHFEANQAIHGLALLTPKTLQLGDLDDLDDHVRNWEILHKYKDRGFRFIFEYDQPHECGVHINCPATVRSTSDSGTLHLTLPGFSIPMHSVQTRNEMVWTPGGSMCSTGTWQGRRAPQSATAYQGMLPVSSALLR
jgi:hypothetical protein